MFGTSVLPNKLKSQHPEEKECSDFQNHFWAYLVVRPLSFYIAPVFIWLGFSSNQVTLFGGGVLLTGIGLLLATTSHSLLLVGALLINLWYLFDFVDGVVARYHNTTSALGAFIDWLIGMMYHTTLPLSVAVILYRTSEYEVVGTVVVIPVLAWFGIAATEIIARLLRRSVIQKAELLSSGVSDPNLQKEVNLRTIVSAIDSFKSPLLFVAIVGSFLDLFLLLYTAHAVVLLIPSIFLMVVSLRE